MFVMASSRQYILIPLPSCPVADPTVFQVAIALLPESADGEPADGDYKTAEWVNGEIARKPATYWQDEYAPGEYMAYVQITAGAEDIRLPAGRIRIGDSR